MEKARKLTDNIIQFIGEFKAVLENSTVDFYTSYMWDHNLNQEFFCELLQLTDVELAIFPCGRISLHDKHGLIDGKFPLLREFVQIMVKNRLDTLALPVDCVTELYWKDSCCDLELEAVERDARSSGREQGEESLNAALSQESRENSELTKRIMGKKKSHEVARMAQKCVHLLSATGINQVVDIGSGKGYLGQFLSLQYGINVISVDSSETNTNGALKRNNRLSKQWKGIVKNATQRRKEKASGAESPCYKDNCGIGDGTNRGSEESRYNDGKDRCPSDSIEKRAITHVIVGENELTLSERTVLHVSSSLQDDKSRAVENSLSVKTPSPLPSSVPVSSVSTSFSTSVSNFPQSGDSSSTSTSLATKASSSTSKSSSSLLVTSVLTPSPAAATDLTLSFFPAKSSITTSKSLPTSPATPYPSSPHSPQVSFTPKTSFLPQEDEQMQSQTFEKVLDISVPSQDRTYHAGDDTPPPKTEMKIEEQREGEKMPAVFASVTGYIDEETDVGDFLQCDENAMHFELSQPFMMVGLHTCGDLAPSMLRIFQSNPSMQCLCNVGCCYHHVTEEFAMTDEWDREHPGIKTGSSFGFPMSAYLREKKVALGRGARMTACMAADRIASEATIDVRGLFYRAVLQVIFRDHFTIPTRKQIIGKLAPKCKSFLEYTRKALRKLKMDETKISDDEINAYEAKYRPYYRHMAAYNQLRAALSPSIEALILLDRLLYLKEQSNIKIASVVRLFDPVTSPRCYGIIAVKTTS